jgi:streptogramin lyase
MKHICMLSLITVAAVNTALAACEDHGFSWARDVSDGVYRVTAAPNGELWLPTFLDGEVIRLASDGTELGRWRCLSDGAYAPVPTAIAVSSSGNVYVAVLDVNEIQEFQIDGTFVRRWGGIGSGPGQFNFPSDVRISRDGKVFVSDRFNNRIQIFTPNGEFMQQWGIPGSGPGQLDEPFCIDFNQDGRLLVLNHGDGDINTFTPDGDLITSWPLRAYLGFAIDVQNRLQVPTFDFAYQQLRVNTYSPDGRLECVWGKPGETQVDEMADAGWVAADAQDNLFVVDRTRNRLMKFTPLAVPVRNASWGALKKLFRTVKVGP